jgi:HSP20 family protein
VNGKDLAAPAVDARVVGAVRRGEAMSRTLTPWRTRAPRLFDFEMDFPRWMSEVFGQEGGGFGREFVFMPEANISESDKSVEIAVELPGMKPEDVKVELHDRALWISGEKKEEKEEKGKTFHRVERRSGSFRRMFDLPAVVEEANIDAKFADGVLKITLPKSEKAAPKKIEVKG